MNGLNPTGLFIVEDSTGNFFGAIEAWMYSRNGLDAEQCAQWCGGQQSDAGITLEENVDGYQEEVSYGDIIIKVGDKEFTSVSANEFDLYFKEIE